MLFNRRLDGDDLLRMRQAGVVVLSAHLDDACFSIGGLLAALGGGVLINVFNRSTYFAKSPEGLQGALPESVVGGYREAEDQAFARQVGLHREQLHGCEPGFFGRRPNDLGGLQEDVLQVKEALMLALKKHVRRNGLKPFLLVPMAIGRHVNHRAVYEIIVQEHQHLLADYRLCFYEDLPYAHDPVERSRGVRRFRNTPCWSAWSRSVFVPNVSTKLALVALYATQLKRKPSWFKFRPAAWTPVALHEALWMAPNE